MTGTPEQEAQHAEYMRRANLDHIFHTWINRRQDERRQAGEPWEPDLYEWKRAISETRRLPHWLKRLREDDLPTVHQQCSHSAPEPIIENKLICALGCNVAECPIVASIYATAREFTERERSPYDVPMDDVDTIVAKVCTWHIFTETLKRPHTIDTSEGYYQDEGDRMFWARTYAYMAMDEPESTSEEVQLEFGETA